MLELVKYAGIALLLSLVVTPGVIKLAFKVGAIDKPNSRKVHDRVMPRLGGLAIFVAFTIPTFMALGFNKQFIGLLLGGIVILVLGVLDDIKDLSPKVKLAGQLVAALILIGFGAKVDILTNPFGSKPIELGLLSIPVTIFWIVGVTNAVNLVDGLDGLAAGIAAIAAATLGLVAMENDPAITVVAFILVGAIIGFMRYNFNPARIFMGDSGSLFLGYTLAGLAIMGLAKSATVYSLFIPVLVLGVPILDTLFAIIRRIINDQPIFKADKAHLHHCLLASGLSHRQAVLVIYLIHGSLSAVAVLLNVLTTTQGMFILLGVSVLTLIGANRLGVMGRLPKSQETNAEGTTIGG